MILEPVAINTCLHPFIEQAFIKKQFNGRGSRGKNLIDVLVIEAKHKPKSMGGHADDRLFIDFLSNLDLIKEQVERTVGHFDRMDIRYH